MIIINNIEVATLGNGCFWCTEAIFQQVKGVTKVTSGYSGGRTTNPAYKSVATGATGHTECVEIVYDSSVISFTDLLEIFWKTHDPTTLNRQGTDIGTQYRSVIFYHNTEQREIAEQYMLALEASGTHSTPLVTALAPCAFFFPAEKYHQNYFKLNSTSSYCQYVVKPKVDRFKKACAERCIA